LGLEVGQYLRVGLAVKMIRNRNLGKFEFVSLRVLETTRMKDRILKIGNEDTINSLSGCIELKPLLEGKYYDL